MNWNLLPQPVTIRPTRKMGAFQATIVVEEVATDELEITQHPVQKGAAVSDHAYKKPSTVSIKRFSSEIDKGVPLTELYKKLIALQAAREPFDVVTGKRSYKNMLFKSLSNTTDGATENVLAITAVLQEVIIVNVATSTVPPRINQKNPGKTGATERAGVKKMEGTEGANGAEQKKSALEQLRGAF